MRSFPAFLRAFSTNSNTSEKSSDEPIVQTSEQPLTKTAIHNNTNKEYCQMDLETARNLYKIYSECQNLLNTLKCPLCLYTINKAAVLPCAHAYCYNCIKQSVSSSNSSCPCCKLSVTKRSITRSETLDDIVVKFKELVKTFGLAPYRFSIGFFHMTQANAEQQKLSEHNTSELEEALRVSRKMLQALEMLFEQEEQLQLNSPLSKLCDKKVKSKLQVAFEAQKQVLRLNEQYIKQYHSPDADAEDEEDNDSMVFGTEQVDSYNHTSEDLDEKAVDDNRNIGLENENQVIDEFSDSDSSSSDEETVVLGGGTMDMMSDNENDNDNYSDADDKAKATFSEDDNDDDDISTKILNSASTRNSSQLNGGSTNKFCGSISKNNRFQGSDTSNKNGEGFHTLSRTSLMKHPVKDFSKNSDNSPVSLINAEDLNSVRLSSMAQNMESVNEREKEGLGDDRYVTFQMGETVEVAKRTWPGINKLGGVAKIVGIEINPLRYDVEYILYTGKETGVHASFVTKYEIESSKRQKRHRQQSKSFIPGEANAKKANRKSPLKANSGVVQATTASVDEIEKVGKLIAKEVKTHVDTLSSDTRLRDYRFAYDVANSMYSKRFQMHFQTKKISVVLSGADESCILIAKALEKEFKKSEVRFKFQEDINPKSTTMIITKVTNTSPFSSDKAGLCSLMRTVKIMRACALGIPIVSTKWLTACLAKRELVAPEENLYIRSLHVKQQHLTTNESLASSQPSAVAGVARTAAYLQRKKGATIGGKQLKPFKGINVYLAGQWLKGHGPKRDDVEWLLEDCGARIIPYASEVFVYLRGASKDDKLYFICDQSNKNETCGISSTMVKAIEENLETTKIQLMAARWVFDSISCGEVLSAQSYCPAAPLPKTLWEILNSDEEVA